jgi:hypothetical protein
VVSLEDNSIYGISACLGYSAGSSEKTEVAETPFVMGSVLGL